MSEQQSSEASHGSPHWLDSPKFHKGLFWGLAAVCAVLIAVDLVVHQHGHFEYETYDGFHAAFGFVAYVTIVTCAKGLRLLVMRSEDYYDE